MKFFVTAINFFTFSSRKFFNLKASPINNFQIGAKLLKHTMNHNRKKVSCLLFDLDGTLYDTDNGMLPYIRDRIYQWMVIQGFASTKEEAIEIWRPLFQKYNQTLRGLMSEGYNFNIDEYWTYQRIGIEKFFQPDVPLRQLLNSLPYKKVIFTNSREKEALQVLNCLGIADCFDFIYGADFMGDVCKPEKESFDKVLTHLNISPDEIIFFEDSVKNLKTGHEFGIRGVLIDSSTATEEGIERSKISDIDYIDGVVTTLSDDGNQLRAIMPFLFDPAIAVRDEIR